MAVERPLSQQVRAFAHALRESEESRVAAREAYSLAIGIKRTPLFPAQGGAPREIGLYDESSFTTYSSRGIMYHDTPRVKIRHEAESYEVFLRVTRERGQNERLTHRSGDKPGIDMLVIVPGDAETARLLLSFEEERVVGPDRTPLDAPTTLQALEVLKDFSARHEAANTAKDSAAASAS